MKIHRGVILAGGKGSRLDPMTRCSSKQLLPVYDKPMVYYALSLLMQQGIRDILIITTPTHLPLFVDLMKDGEPWGLSLCYQAQNQPAGIAQALILAESFIQDQPIILVLGDNIFGGDSWHLSLQRAKHQCLGATIFAYPVKDVRGYGVVTLDGAQRPIALDEKPLLTQAGYAVTGLYLYDGTASEVAHTILPSARGELEMTAIHQHYLSQGKLQVEVVDNNQSHWFDAGTADRLLSASLWVSTWQTQHQEVMACPEVIAYQNQWISSEAFAELAYDAPNNAYGDFLRGQLQSIV